MRIDVDLATVGGMAPDAPPLSLPDGVWTDVRNVRFRDEGMENVGGYTGVMGSLSATALYIDWIPTISGVLWVYASATIAYATDGATHANINNAGGAFSASANLGFTGGNFHGYMLLNDGATVPQSWSPGLANDCTTLSCWPANTTAKIIRPFKDFIFAFDLADATGANRNSRLVRWSDTAAQGALPIATGFDYTDPTNQSGITELGQSNDAILEGAPLRDALMIYKEYRTWRADYVGGGDVFGFREVFTQSGILSNNCVGVLDDSHVVFTDHDIIRHDGNTQQSIVDKRMRRWLFDRIDTTYFKTSFVLSDERKREMLFCFPETGYTAPNLAAVWNWTDNAWSVRELNGTKLAGAVGPVIGTIVDTIASAGGAISTYGDAFDQTYANALRREVVLADSAAGNAFQLDYGATFAGTSINVYAERTGMTLSRDVGAVKRVLALYPKIIGTVGDTVYFYVGQEPEPGAGVIYRGPYAYVIGTSYKIDCRVSGRVIAIKLTYSGTDTFRLYGLEVEFEMDGDR